MSRTDKVSTVVLALAVVAALAISVFYTFGR
jgi:hypothetical protein